MSYVGRRNIKHLSIVIDMRTKKTFELPECLLNCKTLVKLSLDMGGQHYSLVVVPQSFCLPRLRSLFLEGLSFENPGAATRLISSCPILKLLDISYTSVEMDNHQDFTIDSSTLENLTVLKGDWNDSPMAKIIKLNAPNLTSFSCTDNMTREYSLRNLSSLVDAEIEMLIEIKDNLGIMEYPELYLELSEENKEKYGKHLLNLLGALRNVKNLTVPSEGTLEVVSGAHDLGTQLPQFCNLRCLSLCFWFTRRCLRSIVYLLTISPNIESLHLSMSSFTDYPLPPQFGIPDNAGGSHRFNFLVKVGDNWKAGLPLPFTLLHLKHVSIDGVEGQDNELEFLEYLLKTAVVLEELGLRCYLGDVSPDTTRQIDRYCEKLRTLPAASSSLTIKFENLCPSMKPVRYHP